MLRRSVLAAASSWAWFGECALASELKAPTGRPILTITGEIQNTNDGSAANFDMSMLEEFEQDAFETTTPWYEGRVRFDGVPMERLAQKVGASGQRAVVTALNDYQSEIPTADFARFHVLLAVKRNGSYMSVRDKGPLFIIYPFDQYSELRSSTYTSRCAWQVRSLQFV